MSRRTFWSLASCGILICLASRPALAAEPPRSDSGSKKKEAPLRIASKVEVEPVAALTDKEAAEISFAAGRILKHVAQARDAIHDGKRDEAAAHVDQGLKLVAIIGNVLPHYTVKTKISSGDLTYADEDEVTPRYVTLFDELERRDIISPVVQAKHEARRRQHQPGRHSDSAAKQEPAHLAVTHVDVTYSATKLDLELARRMLAAAGRSLAGEKVAEADEALLSIQDEGVLFEREEIDLPLEEAADNLKLAEVEIKEGRLDAAKVALHVAIDQLKRYEKLVGEKRGAEVKALHQEIDKLAAELEKAELSEAELQKLASTISNAWQRATKWFKGKTK